jgi:hypothetical protein
MNVYVYERDYRRCIKACGRTKDIAYCPTCNSVIPPTSVRRSRTGAHGEDVYVHEHPLVFLTLTSSNSGVRRVEVEPGFPERLAARAKQLWLYERVEPEAVEEALQALRAQATQ